jgi:hypothetical protein
MLSRSSERATTWSLIVFITVIAVVLYFEMERATAIAEYSVSLAERCVAILKLP